MEGDDFEKLLEENLRSTDFERVLEQKKACDVEEKPVGALLKEYPNPQATLDLHGHYKEDAEREIQKFIKDCEKSELKTVRIITGRGTGVIKQFTIKLLDKLKRQKVILHYKKEKRSPSYIVYLA